MEPTELNCGSIINWNPLISGKDGGNRLGKALACMGSRLGKAVGMYRQRRGTYRL